MIELALRGREDVELVGAVANGRVALERVLAEQLELLILDLEMPQMDGIELLRELREVSPNTEVIVFSSHSQRGAEQTVEALRLGARDYCSSPSAWTASSRASTTCASSSAGGSRPWGASHARPRRAAPRGLGARLSVHAGARRVGRARGLADRRVDGRPDGAHAAAHRLARAARRARGRGPAPARGLHPALRRAARRGLGAARQGRRARGDRDRGRGLAGPGTAHLRLRRDERGLLCFEHSRGPRIHGCRPAADVLFSSAARSVGDRAVAVVLTGMGTDGCEGARELVAAGGRVFAQDRDSSVVWGMPGAVTRAASSSASSRPTSSRTPWSRSWASSVRRRVDSDGHGPAPERALGAEQLDLRAVMVAEHTGVQLSVGEVGMVEARLLEFMRERGLSLEQVLVEAACNRRGALARELAERLTNAETSFFRDPLLFDELRTWVLPSCSTRPGAGARGFLVCGLLHRAGALQPGDVARDCFPEALAAGRVRLIATDVSRRNLERVRAGCYTRGEINRGLPAAMLVRWFEDEGGCWRIHPRLRELVELRHLSLIDPGPRCRASTCSCCATCCSTAHGPPRARARPRGQAARPDGLMAVGGAEILPIKSAFEAVQRKRWRFYRPTSTATPL
nr:chemotaxis protein CheB [Pseudenhygromyxa sp. WMMC2535]